MVRITRKGLRENVWPQSLVAIIMCNNRDNRLQTFHSIFISLKIKPIALMTFRKFSPLSLSLFLSLLARKFVTPQLAQWRKSYRITPRCVISKLSKEFRHFGIEINRKYGQMPNESLGSRIFQRKNKRLYIFHRNITFRREQESEGERNLYDVHVVKLTGQEFKSAEYISPGKCCIVSCWISCWTSRVEAVVLAKLTSSIRVKS